MFSEFFLPFTNVRTNKQTMKIINFSFPIFSCPKHKIGFSFHCDFLGLKLFIFFISSRITVVQKIEKRAKFDENTRTKVLHIVLENIFTLQNFMVPDFIFILRIELIEIDGLIETYFLTTCKIKWCIAEFWKLINDTALNYFTISKTTE